MNTILKQILLFSAVLCLLPTGCASEPEPAPTPAPAPAPAPKPTPAVTVDWVKGFDTAEEMVEQSGVAIVAQLVSAEVQRRNGLPFTMNTVEVLEVRKGDLQVGDRIPVLQTGAAGTEQPAPAEQPLLAPDTQYALCLELTEPHETYGQYYKIAGGYQGQATYTDTADFAANFAGNFK